MAKKERRELTLKERIDVLEYHEKNPKVGTRSIATTFTCGKTQIQRILQQKDEIKAAYEANQSDSRKRKRLAQFDDIDGAVYHWYKLARQRQVPVNGPMLQEEALKIAEALGNTVFRASNGWLERFKGRHNLKQFTISGEAASVSDVTVASWHERMKELTRGYKREDIWNVDESGCFFRALPDKTLAEKKSACKGGKKAKERITVLFIANAAGEKETPIVIGKAASPRCFKRLPNKRKPLGVPYFSNAKAWMNSEIFTTVLCHLNHRLARQNRKILLLMDNATCHPEDIDDKLSNIKVVFLPKNTTSRLQPLDAGIIKNFKRHYRVLIVKHVIAKIDGQSEATANDIAKSINILMAIQWVKQAWEQVKETTIINCFTTCGASSGVEIADESDPFTELDQSAETAEFIYLFIYLFIALQHKC